MDENRRYEYAVFMALVRILVDGYNLIHAWERYHKFGGNQTHSLL